MAQPICGEIMAHDRGDGVLCRQSDSGPHFIFYLYFEAWYGTRSTGTIIVRSSGWTTAGFKKSGTVPLSMVTG